MAFSPTDNGCTQEEIDAGGCSRGTVPIYMIY